VRNQKSETEHSVPGILERLEHEYSLRDELDSDWAARPLTLVRREGRTMLILEDVGGEPLDRLLGQPMELDRFLRFAVGLATALGELHQQGLIHKEIKPTNILVDCASGVVRLTGSVTESSKAETVGPLLGEDLRGKQDQGDRCA
jgi:serine/threonine protein kinase